MKASREEQREFLFFAILCCRRTSVRMESGVANLTVEMNYERYLTLPSSERNSSWK